MDFKGGRDVKKGGRMSVKNAGTMSTKGKSTGRGEFATECAGACAGGLAKPSATGYRQVSAGRK